MAIDRTVPSERNNTYNPSDVSRKSSEDLFETAFNADQQYVLNNIIADIPQPTPSGPEVPEPTASDNGKVLGVSDGEYALVEQSGGAEVQRIEGINRSRITKIGRLAIVTPKLFLQGVAIPPIDGGGFSQPTGAKIDESFYGSTIADNCVLGSFREANGDLIEVCYVGTFSPNHIAAAINGDLVVTGSATVFNGTFTYICKE